MATATLDTPTTDAPRHTIHPVAAWQPRFSEFGPAFTLTPPALARPIMGDYDEDDEDDDFFDDDADDAGGEGAEEDDDFLDDEDEDKVDDDEASDDDDDDL